MRRISLALVAATAFAACGGSDGPSTTEPESPRATTLIITQSSATLSFLGATVTLTGQVRDQNGSAFSATITWQSSDPAVATVSSTGVLTAVANGNATITATASGLTATVPVTVQQIASVLAIVSGGGQTATVGQPLAESIVVRADDAGGAPVEGAQLTFSVDTEGASLSSTTATTGTGGVASTEWTLGTVAGTQTLQGVVSGNGSGTISVTATGGAAAPTTFNKVSGDLQVGPVLTALNEPVVVGLEDEFGNGVPGVSVSFVVTGGGGSASPTTVATDSDGLASTTWTMGSAQGAASMTAASSGFATQTFTATASPAPLPVPDLVPGAIQVSPTSPTSLETVTVTVPVTNVGNTTTESAVSVRLSVDGGSMQTVSIGTLAASATANAVFTAGPLMGGVRALSVDVDPTDAITETDENNNNAVQSLAVLAQSTLEVGTPLSNVGAAQGVELLFRFELAAEDGSVEFKLAGGVGDADMYVHRGDRPASRDDYECISGAADSNESCVINAAETGTYHILIHAFSTFSGTTLTVETGLPVLPYNIDLVFINGGTSSQNAAFTSAVETWESIIPFDIIDIPFSNQPVAADACITGQPAVTDDVDDLRIFVSITTIDGPGGTLGQAGPCSIRTASGLPVLGTMEFDTEDLAALESRGELTGVILHEMGHVLGIGTTWSRAGLLKNPSANNPGVDTHFDGPAAVQAFQDLGGASYTGGAVVPVENTGEAGSADGHWRESVFLNELMTPFLNTGSDPLSLLSVQSLVDVGYRVDSSKAQNYSRVFTAPAPVSGPFRPGVDLSGDLRTGPVYEVDARGRVVRTLRR